MNLSLYNILLIIFITGFLYGIRLMNSPSSAVKGNLLGGLSMLCAVAATMIHYGIIDRSILWLSMGIGGVAGLYLGLKAAMIQMPQFVALLNGLGGGASALTAFAILGYMHDGSHITGLTGGLALAVGTVTFGGSMIAAAKLDRKLSQKPIKIGGHTAIGYGLIIVMALLMIVMMSVPGYHAITVSLLTVLAALIFGIVFTIRIGGADMPITISLLNSLSGLAGSIAGFAVRNTLLIAVGAVVGAAGLILTRIMCRAMNRTLFDVITGRTTAGAGKTGVTDTKKREAESPAETKPPAETRENDIDIIRNARRIVIVPGYGMALSQAQHAVRELYEKLSAMDKDVLFAIHPVAGRMPGHMNVLLAEADIPYDRLLEMEEANNMFNETDVVIIVGANDVVNPSATTAEGTPIYGMPILTVTEAKWIIVCNLDREPGYAGVENPLYDMGNVSLRLGDGKEMIGALSSALTG